MARRSAALIAALTLAVGLFLGPAVSAGEIGPNDPRISQMGPDGTANYRGFDPVVAYNSNDDLYFVVWWGDDNTGPLVQAEYEIFGRLVGPDGFPQSPQFRISDMGPNGDTGYFGREPAVTYNPDDNEFLVVWYGDDIQEVEIYGQRLDATTGAEVGTNDFRISDMGPNGSPLNSATTPAVAYDAVDRHYLVVWSGDDTNGDMDIYGQLVDGPTGSEIGGDFRISAVGPNGSASYLADIPDVVHNPARNEFLVVWYGDDNALPLVDNDFEIFGQRLLGGSGNHTGADDFRISDMGPDADTGFHASAPAVAYNPHQDEYLVVWNGDDDTGTLIDDEREIFGQRLTGSGAPAGANDFRISHMGPDGDTSHLAATPAVVFDGGRNEYLVVWMGNEVGNEFEIYGQLMTSTGAGLVDDFRISDMGPEGNPIFIGNVPAVAHANPYLIVWQGDDDTGALVDEDYEIFGQLWEPDAEMVGLVDVSQGIWHLRDTSGAVTSFWYGNPGDLPIAGDWDGDGDATPGLYRQSDGFFYSRNSNTTGVADDECFAGNPEDIPVVGDWDGDGDDNLGIYRPSEQKFYLYTITCADFPMGAAQVELLFGNPGDKPVAGDWDGDGIDEPGLHRESTGFFYWRNTLDTGIASGEIFFGDPADRFVSGDWGVVEGIDTPAVFRPSNQTFYFRHTLTQGVADSQFTWNGAGSGWLPIAGDFGLD